MSTFEDKFERFLQSHIHPDVQPAARRITHPELGRISMEAFLDVAGIFQANHEAFDEQMIAEARQQGLPTIERTEAAQLGQTIR